MSISEKLEAAIDIKDLVSKYVTLKKAGVNYKSVCPFPGHNEKTPSFVVSPVKQIAYCFGCHKGWGPIKFTMDIENCEFKDAIQILWSITGIAVDTNFNQEKFEEKKNLYSLYRDAAGYYTSALKNYPEVKKYIYDRGISEEIMNNFHFWYSDSWVALYDYLAKKGYDNEMIEKSNIFLDMRTKKDKFINRIIFPIQNARGDFVAFTARIIGKWEPKYLNSPASDLYDKSSILYGLFHARTTISKEGFVIVTEGQMDTIALQSAGILNTVAVSGSALTDKHLQLLKRLTKKVFLCFDGDKAGEKATKASLEKMKNKWFEAKIISLPEGKDPDDIVTGWENFEDYIKNALSPIAYYIEKSDVDTSSIDDKKNILWEFLEVISSYSDNIEKDHYLKEVAHILKINEKIVYDSYNKRRTTVTTKEVVETSVEKITAKDMVIAYCLSHTQSISYFKNNILFPEAISQDLSEILDNGAEALKSLPLDKKEKFKALSLKLDSEISSDFEIKESQDKILRAYNIESYKFLTIKLKEKMNHGDENAFLKYSQIIAQAKQNGIK